MRKPRRPRRRRMRLNPTDDYRSALREHLDSTKTLPENWPVVEEDVDFSDINMIFPRSVREYPMLEVQKVAERLGDRPYVRSVRRQPSRFSEFDQEGLLELGQQQGLSLVEMQGLARRYKDAGDRRKKTTIPASSALCGANRRPKLRDYKLPRALATYPAGSYHKKVLIWISPEGSYPIRIMTFRRNTHIDCDMLVDAEKGRSYGGVLALAIQDTLLWLSQKPKSRGNAECFVGRIGSPDIYRFWGPGQDFRYTSALNTMQVGKIPVTKYDDAARQADIEAYFRAAGGSAPRPPATPPPAGPTGGGGSGGGSGGAPPSSGSGGAPPSSGSGRSRRRSRKASTATSAPGPELTSAPAPEPAPAPQPAPSRKRRSRDISEKAKDAAEQAVAQTPSSAPKATIETPEQAELEQLITTQGEELPSLGQTEEEPVVEEELTLEPYYGDDESLDDDSESGTFGQEPGAGLFGDATLEKVEEFAGEDIRF